jgi:hypothetical protein
MKDGEKFSPRFQRELDRVSDGRMIRAHKRNTGPMLMSTRCGAVTRSGRPCGGPVMQGKVHCRMHGGAKVERSQRDAYSSA